jgi:metacaspase-1
MALKAFLVGINKYEFAEDELKGCVPDVNEVQRLLINQQRVRRENVRKIIDAQATTGAILDGLRWLMKVDPGEKKPRRLFHYSGHGTWLTDDGNDEKDDRKDECLCPVDYASRGPLRDDVLRKIYRQATPETHLLLLMDCCHSGTNQRIPGASINFRTVRPPKGELGRLQKALLKARLERDAKVSAMVEAQLSAIKVSKSESPAELKGRIKELIDAALRRVEKRRYGLETVRGNTVLLAGCRPDQLSADASFGRTWHGALTYYVLKGLAKSPGISYTKLIAKVGKALEDNGYDQIPQLECDKTNLERPFLDFST